jgi:putative thioredoxin
MEALVRLGQIAEARAALDELDPLTLEDPRVAALKAHIGFSSDDAVDPALLIARIAQNPADLGARLELARHHVRIGDYEPALQQLLEIVRRDRKFDDDAARKTMLEVFNLLGAGNELVGTYRRMLAAALY